MTTIGSLKCIQFDSNIHVSTDRKCNNNLSDELDLENTSILNMYTDESSVSDSDTFSGKEDSELSDNYADRTRCVIN